MNRLHLLVVLVELGLSTVPHIAGAQAQPVCAVGQWTSSRVVEGVGTRRMDNISVSVGARGTVIAGSPELTFRTDSTSPSPREARGAWLRVLPLGGTVLPSPAGDFLFVDPRVAVDSRDRVHVVWGEPAPGTDVTGAPSVSALDVASLWHAMWSDGRWTTPTLIYEASHIAWNRFRSSNLIADRNGGLDVSVPVQTADFEPSVVHLHFDTKSWSSHAIAAPATVIYTDIASLSDKRLALVFVAAGRGFREGPTESELFITTSADDGASWAPLQIGEASQVPAYSPRLAADDDGRLHMVWIQHAPRSTTTEALWHRSSDDGGRTWSAGARIPLTVQVREPSIVTDTCGTLHVAVQSQGSTRANILYARVVNGAWTPLDEPFPQSINRAPLLWRDSDARIHMLRYQAPVVPDWSSHYKLVLSELEPAARRRGR